MTSFAQYEECEVAGTVKASGGDLGGAVKHWLFAVDLYNHTVTGDVTMTLCCERSDPHHVPCVVIKKDDIGASITVCGGSYGAVKRLW